MPSAERTLPFSDRLEVKQGLITHHHGRCAVLDWSLRICKGRILFSFKM